jgi:hypothetical protein
MIGKPLLKLATQIEALTDLKKKRNQTAIDSAEHFLAESLDIFTLRNILNAACDDLVEIEQELEKIDPTYEKAPF